MKKLFLFIIIIISTSFIITIVNAATQIALWEFENDYQDSIGNYHLTANGTVPFVTGICGEKAVDFNYNGKISCPIEPGTLDYLQSNVYLDKCSFNSTGLSIMGWINIDQYFSGCILTQHQTSGSLSEMGYGVNFSSTGIALLVRSSSGGLYGRSLVQIVKNEWTHFAITWDGSCSGGIQVYLNGYPVNTQIDFQGYSFSGMTGESVPLRIGASHCGSDQMAHSINGQIDHLSLWQGALTPEEVLADYETSHKTVEDLVNDLEEEINTIALENLNAFKDNSVQRSNALTKKIEAIIESLAIANIETDPVLQDELCEEVIHKLQNDIMAKMDGCLSDLGVNDKNDWIVDCDAQVMLTELIDKIVSKITEKLISN